MSNPFKHPIQELQFYDKYARFDQDLGHREDWTQTVTRTVTWLDKQAQGKLPSWVFNMIYHSIYNLEVMPSMRSLAMAGKAADRQNLAIYNCSALPIIDWDCFVEALIISMSGCGVGFSVESQFINQLPIIKPRNGHDPHYFTIEDTTEGWADALAFGLKSWANGEDVVFDYSLIRPAGAVLKTKGGQASGPEPLKALLDFARRMIIGAEGRRLTSIEAHDLMCMVGSAAVSGGVRRTAMISLFDFDDQAMRHAKDSGFDQEHPYRWNANNSAVWPNRRLAQEEISDIFQDMVNGMTGEPGIFNRRSADFTRPIRRQEATWLVNPCGEINLRPFGLCNLTSVICRADDTIATLRQKVMVATIIGTIQSLATKFPGLRPEWEANAKEERLLGVSLDGQLDCKLVQDPNVMHMLKEYAIQVNRDYAQLLGINQSAAVTCVKPSGNSSQLLNCSSGLHARWSKYYVRNIRVSAHSPIYRLLKDQGVPMVPDNNMEPETAITWVIPFPVKSPDGAIVRTGRGAIEQCNYWLQNKIYWTEHNPSVTITYNPDEVEAIKQWLYEHQDVVGGMAFLPNFDMDYALLPYQEITEADYYELLLDWPIIDYSRIAEYEHEDQTTAAQELACSAGFCEFVP